MNLAVELGLETVRIQQAISAKCFLLWVHLHLSDFCCSITCFLVCEKLFHHLSALSHAKESFGTNYGSIHLRT